MTCRDWRQLASSDVAHLLAREADAWLRDLSWDVRSSWRVIEPARAAGALPGFVATDSSGRVTGWTWFLRQQACLQVGGLVASAEPVVRALVRAVMTSEGARGATACVWSVRGEPPGLVGALGAQGLEVGRYLYLSADLPFVEAADAPGRAWTAADAEAAAQLCARAYDNVPYVRAYAPNGTPDEWRAYLRSLFDSDGCGRFQPAASFVSDAPDGGLSGGIITSTIATGVGHVSQVMVRPEARGAGLGARLLRGAMEAYAARQGRRITLLVAEGNVPAERMYARAGFRETARFVVAATQPRRLTSVALTSGGASTRR